MIFLINLCTTDINKFVRVVMWTSISQFINFNNINLFQIRRYSFTVWKSWVRTHFIRNTTSYSSQQRGLHNQNCSSGCDRSPWAALGPAGAVGSCASWCEGLVWDYISLKHISSDALETGWSFPTLLLFSPIRCIKYVKIETEVTVLHSL